MQEARESEFVGGRASFVVGYVANRHAPQPDATSRFPVCAICRRLLVQVRRPGCAPFWRHERYTFTQWSNAD